MAIIVKQDKEPINWFSVISWAIVIGIIFISGYYLFFVRPPLVDFVLPVKLAETVNLAKIKFDPAFLIESEVYKVLEKGEYGTIPESSGLGKPNPFLNFAPPIKPGRASVNIKSATSTATSSPVLIAQPPAVFSTSSIPQPPIFTPLVSSSSSPQ
ncbi:MAG: hypothetical protein HYW34_02640 [Candidatus Brennerbacteria bacterium]|nr:hypothetical protein [Candidatus Brennerbacteria bacterium]